MKYVMFTHETIGLKVPMFFPDRLVHACASTDPGWFPTSAGHWSPLSPMDVSGKSDSLGLSPDPDDAEVCARHFAGFDQSEYVQQDTDENLRRLRHRREAVLVMLGQWNSSFILAKALRNLMATGVCLSGDEIKDALAALQKAGFDKATCYLPR